MAESKLVARGQFTLVHLHDGKGMQMYLKCNQPTVQHYSLVTHRYSPDYTNTAVEIVPELYFSGSSDNQIAHIKNTAWTINGQPPIQFGGFAETALPFKLKINKNLTGANQLDIAFSCVVTDPDTKLEITQKASICITKQEIDSFTPMLLLTTPKGTLFKNELYDKLTAECRLMVGSSEIIDGVKHKWYEQQTDGYVPIEDSVFLNGQGTNTLNVVYSHIQKKISYKCEVLYKGSTYTEFVTFSKQSDPYIISIENKNGDKMHNGQGVIYCEAHLSRGGQPVSDELAETMFAFQWKKYKKHSGVQDTSWRNPTTRVIELTKEDIDTLSTFTCEVTAKNNVFPYVLPIILQ